MPAAKWNYEFVSLGDEALTVSGRPEWSWEPEATARTWKKLDDSVPEKTLARQFALREIARRLEATEFYKGQAFALRAAESADPFIFRRRARCDQEGAIFAMTNGTNPELLVQVEARHDKTDTWHITCAASVQRPLQRRKLDDNELWTAEAVDARDPRQTLLRN